MMLVLEAGLDTVVKLRAHSAAVVDVRNLAGTSAAYTVGGVVVELVADIDFVDNQESDAGVGTAAITGWKVQYEVVA